MLELASVGAKVLQIRSVEIAMKFKVPLWVKSSFSDDPGTLGCEEDKTMEDILVSGVALDRNEAQVSVRDLPDKPGVAAKIFGALDERAISVDLIVQNTPVKGKTDLTFTVGKADLPRAHSALGGVRAQIAYAELLEDPDVAKISVVGVGMRSHAGVANTMFRALADKAINIQVISTSEIKVSVLIAAEYTELAVRALHTAYGLDGA